MKYTELYSKFKNIFYEDADFLEKLAKKTNVDENDGMHILFSFVVVPFVIDLLSTNNSEKIKKAFSFFEEMARSETAEITEVLEFTVLENIITSDQLVYNIAKKYMGIETLKSCENVEKYLKKSDS